jgi:hypothetical protein
VGEGVEDSRSFSLQLGASIAFGLCPQDEILYFENLIGDRFPFIDPRDYTTAATKLANHPELQGYNFKFGLRHYFNTQPNSLFRSPHLLSIVE